MSTDVIDLNDLVPQAKKVEFHGRTFKVPGDMPLSMYLQMNLLADKADENKDDAQAMSGMVDLFIDLFHREYDGTVPIEESREWLREQLLGIGANTLTSFLGAIYPADVDEPAADPEAEEAVELDDVDPPQPSDGETSTTS